MADNLMPAVNGLDQIPPIKTEPIDDPLLDSAEPAVVPKEYLESDGSDNSEVSESEEMPYFTQVEVDNTRKCLENTRLIIKDFETQLDWHLQQYMLLRNPYNLKKNSKGPGRGGGGDDSKRQDLLSISQLSMIIANHPEGNKKFIKRSGAALEANGKRYRKNKDSDSDGDSDFSDDNSDEYDEEEVEGRESEEVDDPGVPPKKKKPKKVVIKRGKNKELDPLIVPKEEIEEEIHELMVPKEEKPSDDEDYGGKVSPSKKVKKPKLDAKSSNKKRVGAGKAKKNMETVDLTGMKSCQVFLNRLPNDPQDSIIEIKDEDIDRDELIELLQTKAINSLEKFSIDAEKPVAMLKADNLQEFDFNNCKTSNVIVTFEGSDNFPDFVFAKNIANYVLNGLIKLVQSNVLNQHLTGQKV